MEPLEACHEWRQRADCSSRLDLREAALDGELWPGVLIELADAMGAAQIAVPSFDLRANLYKTIAPRIDPDLLASYREYWALRDPVLGRAILVAEDQFSALVCISNAPGKDSLTRVQLRLFEAIAGHLGRAVRINRQLWKLEFANLAATERIEMRSEGALLADASGRVVRANAPAKAMLDARDGKFLCDGHLAVAGSPDALQKLVASCARRSLALGGPGGELTVPRKFPHSPLHVTVTPLRSKARLADVPWTGVAAPVAMVTVRDPEFDRQQKEKYLRRRFGLTAAETGLAAEILMGTGRKAAARRRGISDSTAKTQLSNIFDKTGTRRQAELVRVLPDATEAREVE